MARSTHIMQTPLTVRAWGRAGEYPFWLATVLAWLLTAGVANLADAKVDDGAIPVEADAGIAQCTMLGKWTPIYLRVPADSRPSRFEVTSVDGDDTPIIYAGKLLVSNRDAGQYQAWARIGRKARELVLRIYDDAGDMLGSTQIEFNGEQSSKLYESTRPLLVVIGNDPEIKNSLESTFGSGISANSEIVVSVETGDALPLSWVGYDAAKSIVLVTSDLEQVTKLTDSHVDAIEAWVEQGGKLIVSVGQNGKSLLGQGGVLRRLAPGKFNTISNSSNSRRLETFAESREQLLKTSDQSIPISTFENVSGRVVLEDRDSHPLVIARSYGLGQVIFVAFDLDSPIISQWRGFGNLLDRLVSDSRKRNLAQPSSQGQTGTSVAHYGYEDLIGQLRAPLDVFSDVKMVQFTLIAILIVLYILCIGPGDYFLLRKLFKKMELTWITFPLVSLTFCGLAIAISQFSRPQSVRMNQLEIIDVDGVEGRARGSVWTNIYSPSTKSVGLEIASSHPLGFQIDSDLLSWHGLPGKGLGGMQNTTNPVLQTDTYRQKFEDSEDSVQRFKTKIENLSLQVSSSKPVFAHWWADTPVPIRSRLRRKNRLTGTFTNPFDVTLYNCRVMFEDYAYVLKDPLEPGQTFDVQTESIEKTIRSLLTRRATTEKTDRTDSTPWDPTDKSIRRITDMMMFFGAAGGSGYTGLTHGYQPFVDLTEQLELKRAVLVAEIDRRGAEILIDGQSSSEQYDQTITIMRIVLPVEYSKK